MKKNIANTMMILSLHLLVLACSKTESNDMMFKNAVSSDALSAPIPGESSGPMPDPSVIVENDPAPAPMVAPVVVITNSAPTSSSTTSSSSNTSSTTTTDGTSNSSSSSSTTKTHVTNSTVTQTEDVVYKETEIPACKLNVTFNGLGGALNVAVASASKADLMSKDLEGFSALSVSELDAMRDAVDKKVSSGHVQYIGPDDSFNKSLFPKGSKVLIVHDGKESANLTLSGLGKDAAIYIMNVSEGHNTVCLQGNGVTGSMLSSTTILGDPMFVSRGHVDANGSGAFNTYMKIVGGNQTGADYNGNSIKGADLTMIVEGKNDTFGSISGNCASDDKFVIKIKGKNDTGFGMKANSIKGSKMHMEIEGEDRVSTMMSVGSMSNNDVSGWLKSKSGAKLDPLIADLIDLMPLP